jgi:hypothetical protein
VPSPSVSTFQHIAPSSQVSMPDVPDPSTPHGSPIPAGNGGIRHRACG